ncbi:DUF2490 domain-containing protein [Flammeovirga sp. SubArs3]|uniref:DUF2490 domain-containing protein n=1 Tax=Flammeovirga sp. SubArs3 TaxID=2995316 RepID=UPI00248BAEAD|nr:DUF2490 domain-containing protein [Flammeovirga sp. SubArs3]
MKFIKIVLLTLLFVWQHQLVHAQSQGDPRLWLHYFNKAKFNDKWSLSTDGAYLHMFDLTANRLQVRSGLTYKINNNFSVRAGLGYFYVFDPEGENISEIRPMQDFIGKHNLTKDKSFFVKYRFRLEQQIMDIFYEGQNEKDYLNRLRYSIIFRKKFAEKWMAGIGTELFFVLRDKSNDPFTNKNRFIMLINRQVSEKVSLEAQYIREDSFKYQQGSVRYSNILRLAVRHSIDFEK